MPRPAAAPADPPVPAGRRPALRGLPAGYDLDRLPLAVPPVPGEQAASWLSRVAHRYGLTPHALLTAIGTPTPSYNVRAVARHLHRHTAQVTALLGAPPPGRSQADSRFLDGALAGYQLTYAGGVGRWPSGSRFCPPCLTGTAGDAGQSGEDRAAGVAGVWSASWLSPLQVVCLTHRVLLVPSCPGCGQVPWSSSAWTARSRPGWTCPEHLPVPRWRPGQPPPAAKSARRAECRHDLRSASASPVSDRDVGVQQHLNAAAEQAGVDPNGPAAVCGTGTTRVEYLHALLELVGEHQQAVAGLWRLRTDPRLLLDSLAAAVAVLTEPDPGGAVATAERHGLLNRAGRCTPTGPDGALRRRRRNELLAALRFGVADRAGELSATMALTVRVGSGRPRYPEPGVWCGHEDGPLRGGQLPLRAVPQLLWPGLLTDHLPDAPPGALPGAVLPEAGEAVLARAGAAMFLARVGSTRPWRLIAIELGLPAWFADQLPALHRRLVERGRWPAFLTDLDRLATALETDLPPVDYRARRQLCADPRRVLAAVRTARHLYAEPAPPAIPEEMVARMFWATYTGGDLRLAPPPIGSTDWQLAAATEHYLDRLRPGAMPVLLTAQAVLEASSPVGGTGPLTWTPMPSNPTVRPVAAKHVLVEASSKPTLPEQQDWGDWQDNIALAAALSAAEQDLTERAFAPWLRRWLQVNYGIPDTDGNTSWAPLVWSLRAALTDPGTDPDDVDHPALAGALGHSTRSPEGTVQRWLLLRGALPDRPPWGPRREALAT